MKRVLAVLAVLVGAVALASCSSAPPPAVDRAQQGSPTSAASRFAYEGEDGRTALELLWDHAVEVGVVGTGANAFVTSINGVAADESQNEFWALYVDGTAARTGAGSLETRSGQEIVWVVETF